METESETEQRELDPVDAAWFDWYADQFEKAYEARLSSQEGNITKQ